MTTWRFTWLAAGAAALGLIANLRPLAAQEAVGHFEPGREVVQQKLLTPGLSDRWPLAVQQDEQVRCTVQSDVFDPVLELVDEADTVLASDDGRGTRSELWQRMPKQGKVAFRVRPFQGLGGGSYTISLLRFRTERLASDGEAAHEFDDEGWWHYRVALQEGSVLVPTVLGEGRLAAVVTDRLVTVAEIAGGYRASYSGDYFVRIEGPAHRRCQTLLQLARRLELGDEPVDERARPYGIDWWRLPIAPGEALQLDVAMPGAMLDCELVETEPLPGRPAFVVTGSLDKGGMVRRFCVGRRQTVLELRLRNRAPGAVAYAVHVRRGGTLVPLGSETNDCLPLGDGRVFELPLTAGQLVHVELASEAFDARFDLWDPDGSVVVRADDRSPLDRTAECDLLVGRPGAYRLLVYTAGGAGQGPFQLLVREAAVPLLAMGGSLAVDVPDGAPRYVHLDLAAGQECWLAVTSRTGDPALRVLDPAGDGGFVAEGGGVDGNVLVAYRASHTGRHTLVIESRRGSGPATVRALLP